MLDIDHSWELDGSEPQVEHSRTLLCPAGALDVGRFESAVLKLKVPLTRLIGWRFATGGVADVHSPVCTSRLCRKGGFTVLITPDME